jgi:hypothetical protein
LQDIVGETDLIRLAVKCLSRDLSQEREAAVALLFELSKSYSLCEKIGATNGAILLLVGMLSSRSENLEAIYNAEQTLTNLEGCDKNVRQMAENGRIQPLLTHLVEGSCMIHLPVCVHHHRHHHLLLISLKCLMNTVFCGDFVDRK